MPKLLRTSDKVLFILNFFGDLIEDDPDPLGIFSSSYQSLYLFAGNKKIRNNYQQSISRSKRSGLIEKKRIGGVSYLKLTSVGRNHLFKSFPNLHFRNQREWDGKWRLASFDVSENYRKIRNLLRSLLISEYGFVKFHQSLYLSPRGNEGDIYSYLKNTGLGRFVRIFTVSALGDDRELAYRLWDLENVNEKYRSILKEYEIDGNLPLLRGRYLEIAACDPFLPEALLPDDWLGKYVEKKALEKS